MGIGRLRVTLREVTRDLLTTMNEIGYADNVVAAMVRSSTRVDIHPGSGDFRMVPTSKSLAVCGMDNHTILIEDYMEKEGKAKRDIHVEDLKKLGITSKSEQREILKAFSDADKGIVSHTIGSAVSMALG